MLHSPQTTPNPPKNPLLSSIWGTFSLLRPPYSLFGHLRVPRGWVHSPAELFVLSSSTLVAGIQRTFFRTLRIPAGSTRIRHVKAPRFRPTVHWKRHRHASASSLQPSQWQSNRKRNRKRRKSGRKPLGCHCRHYKKIM